MNRRIDEEINVIWKHHTADFNKRLCNWAKALNCGREVSTIAKETFHQWKPLKTYISVSKSSSSARAVYSMRFYGQEVALLTVKNKEVLLCLKGHARKNQYYFGIGLKDGTYPWRGSDAKKFRASFKSCAKDKKGFPKVKSREHRVETKFIAEMRKGANKFGVSGLQIQPVMIADKFPLQIPVPISANTGKPKPGNGYIDILARRKAKDNRVRLSIWELKKPGEYKYAASQAYIYAYAILKILRQSQCRDEWYKLFGFKSRIPSSLIVEAVVAITKDQKNKYLKEKELLMNNASFDIGKDRIRLFVAFYEEDPDSIRLEENPFL